MSAITITIIESELRLVAGIPQTLTLETNVPATVFYTLDGYEPNTSSEVYIDPIVMPNNQGTVIFKAFATDGTTRCPTITQEYGPVITTNRNPRDAIQVLSDLKKCPPFPFSNPSSTTGTNGIYLNTGGIDVNDPLQPQIPDGYDGTATGTPSNYTNQPLPVYDFIFSETNSIGEMGKGIGTLPAGVVVIQDLSNSPQQTTDTSSPFFDAKALVIYQDSRSPQYDDIPLVNRPWFNLENEETARDGALKQTSDVQPPMGSALRQFYNPKDNTIQYSYHDSRTNRWIFSKVEFNSNNPDLGNYSKIVFPASSRNDPGARYVFKWIPFTRRRLF